MTDKEVIEYKLPRAVVVAFQKRLKMHEGSKTPPILFRSEVIDHQGKRAAVYAPCKITRTSTKKTSKEAIAISEHIAKLNNTIVWHGGNGSEVCLHIGGKKIHVDGYMPLELTVIEYNGDRFHPNPLIHPFSMVWPGSDITDPNNATMKSGYHYDKHMAKISDMELMGFRVIVVRGMEWSVYKQKAETRPILRRRIPTEQAKSSLKSAGARADYLRECAKFIPLKELLQSIDGIRKHYDLHPEHNLDADDLKLARNVQIAIQFKCLTDITKGKTITESINLLIKDASDMPMPLSLNRSKWMTKREYAICHSIACGILKTIFPDALNGKQFETTNRELEREELIKRADAHLLPLIKKYGDHIVSLFGKGKNMVDLKVWTVRKTLAIFNGTVGKMYGLKLKVTRRSSSKTFYQLFQSEFFRWNGKRYRLKVK